MTNYLTCCGFHGWSPGLAGDRMTADPNDAWLRPLFRYLNENQVRPIWLGQQHGVDPELADHMTFTEAVTKGMRSLIAYHRWNLGPDAKYADRNAAALYEKQMLAMANENGVGMAIFDGDYMISKKERNEMLDLGARLFAPAFFPKKGFEQLFYPPIESVANKLTHLAEKKMRVTYIGNNYDRYDVAKAYLGVNMPGHAFPEIHVYGNWMTPSNNRESPEQVMNDFPSARFYDRLDRNEVTSVLSQGTTTIHLGKLEYLKTGFIALRWQEAYLAKVPAMLPIEYRLPNRVLGQVIYKQGVKEALYDSKSQYWQKHVKASQAELVEQVSQFEPWFKLAWELRL